MISKCVSPRICFLLCFNIALLSKDSIKLFVLKYVSRA